MSHANGWNHAEAFALMCYQCEACSLSEWIWNSRDGVTPFGIDCRRCGEAAFHVNWQADQFAPQHNPKPGDRYFRDGLLQEARAIMRSRLDAARGTEWEVQEEDYPFYVDGVDETSEFAPGWPHLVVRGSDADTISSPSKATRP